MRILVLALDGVFDTGFAVTIDAFQTANNLSNALMGGDVRFDVTTVGFRRSVKTRQGLTIPTQPISADLKPDWIITPALGTTNPATLLEALQRADVRKAITQVGNWASEGGKVAASCIGTFVIAETGLLDDYEATTTWSLAPLFRQRYSKVRLDETRMLVPTEIGITAGSALGHLDLALWLIRHVSPDLASLVSRYLLADIRSSQAPYIIPNHLAQSDELILRFERWARGRLQDGFSLQEAAKALASSPRSLQRRCQAVLGKSPLAYFQDLRVERAKTLIQSSGLALEKIATEVGYEDGATLRTLLRSRLGRGVRELRADLL
jgi:transcriptional regulator GlxA family with amidase domain